MSELNPNSPEVHSDWCTELLKKCKNDYDSINDFAHQNSLEYLSCFWFFRGCPVAEDIFKEICKVLRVDPIEVQRPK